jgi:hypothetical protein
MFMPRIDLIHPGTLEGRSSESTIVYDCFLHEYQSAFCYCKTNAIANIGSRYVMKLVKFRDWGLWAKYYYVAVIPI